MIAGDGDLFVAGGVESMTRAPLVTAKPDAPFARGDRTIYDTTLGWRFVNPRYEERFSTSRWARRPRTSPSAGRLARGAGRVRAALAGSAGRRRTRRAASPTSSIPAGELERDEHPRPDTRREARALRPAFRKDGTVTAGNACGINDGAAALVIASEERARDSASSRSGPSSAPPSPASTPP